MQVDRSDNEARRAYWREQMETAAHFMDTISACPVEENGEPLVALREVAAIEGPRVAFSETRIADRFGRLFFLREGLIEPFLGAAREMNERGWVLKVEDAYRSVAMQTALGAAERIFDMILERVVWELAGGTPGPELVFRRVTALVATWPKIGTHMSGSAIDISVLRQDDGTEIDRGAPYIEMSERTPMTSPFVDDAARRNRGEITALMARHGFVAYPYEFWHYSQGDAYDEYLNKTGRPGRYGAVELDPTSGRTTAVADPLAPLHTTAEIETRIEQALRRSRGTQ